VIRVALIDGDVAIRAGRRLMIDSQVNLQLVYEESEAQVALEKVPELLVDVIVIDHRLKGFDGLQLAKKLVDAFSDKGEPTPTIVITGAYATPELVLAAIRCGASDVVTQDAPLAELLTAIKNSESSKHLADFSTLAEVLNHSNYAPQPDPLFILRRSQLGELEKLVLQKLDEGLVLAQVSKEINLSDDEFRDLLLRIQIQLHVATQEQLLLALHDGR
jgi:DNA-binding NarL/FixJ family response regulator